MHFCATFMFNGFDLVFSFLYKSTVNSYSFKFSCYLIQEKDDLPVSSFLSTSQQKSFESIVKTPYQSPYVNGENRSIESPYTSLGSGRSSYVSIKQATYSTLRAKAEKASSLHESKSKGEYIGFIQHCLVVTWFKIKTKNHAVWCKKICKYLGRPNF